MINLEKKYKRKYVTKKYIFYMYIFLYIHTQLKKKLTTKKKNLNIYIYLYIYQKKFNEKKFRKKMKKPIFFKKKLKKIK